MPVRISARFFEEREPPQQFIIVPAPLRTIERPVDAGIPMLDSIAHGSGRDAARIGSQCDEVCKSESIVKPFRDGFLPDLSGAG